ncbi:MAG: ABC transporter permease [Bacteroidetes bacterium QH_9_67_14]|nr:MAG: ABC transporter permease [Bacteroidetes bacterium QH_9_67_14]
MAALTRRLLRPVHTLGKFVMLMAQAVSSIGEVSMYRKNLISQMTKIGVESLPIVSLAAFFSGAVMTVQTAYQMTGPFVPKSVIGSIVAPTMILELGVVGMAFVLAGRVGARIAAELGTMRVSDQIDALEVMGLNSVAYLILPRVLGGYLSAEAFVQGAQMYFNPFDPFFGLIKAFVFGFLITSISCYKGYYTSGGAEGVGDATTEAAVASCVFMLFADLLLAAAFL